MKVITSLLVVGLMLGGLSGCASDDTPPPTVQSIKPHLLPEQVGRIARERAVAQKVDLNDYNMMLPQVDRRGEKLIWSVLYTPKKDGVIANFFIEIDDATREATFHGEHDTK